MSNFQSIDRASFNRGAENSSRTKDRLFFLDFLKAISIFVVVSFHSVFVPVENYAASWVLLETVFAPFKFCVPVLLTISFFLLEKSINKLDSLQPRSLIKKRLSRLAIPTAFWFGLMAILQLIKGDITSILELLGVMLTGRIFTGSYFLCALFQLIPLFILVRGLAASKRGVAIAIALQSIFFIAIAKYASDPTNQFILFLKSCGLSLFAYWFVYLILGAFIYRNFTKISELSRRTPIFVKCLFLLLSNILLCSEYYHLIKNAAGTVAPFDYAMISCIPSAIAMFFCFISVDSSQFSPQIVNIIKILSKYSLGIFCINGIVSRFLMVLFTNLLGNNSFGFLEIFLMKLASWALLLGISLGIAIILKRLGLKQIVC